MVANRIPVVLREDNGYKEPTRTNDSLEKEKKKRTVRPQSREFF